MTQLKHYTKDGISISAYDVLEVAPYVTAEIARRRLKRWVAGLIGCDEIYAMPRTPNNYPGKSLLRLACVDLQPRRRIEDLPPLSEFERRWLKRLEAEDAEKLTPYQDNRGRSPRKKKGS